MEETVTMGIMLLFVLLFSSMINGYGIPYTNNVYGNQTWNEAANDSTCSMIGLNLKGEVEDSIDNVTSSIVLGKYQTAWIGVYAKRVWINFNGCYFGRFKINISWLTMTSSGDPAKICLKHCNYSRFVLADGKCVCYKDVKVFSQTGCIAKQCTNTKYPYCGKGTALNSRNITFQCMCRFNEEDYLSNLSGEGDCLAVTHEPKQFIAMNCSNTYKPICYDPGNKTIDLSKSSSNWLQSLSECYAGNKQLAGHGKTTNLTGIPNGTYWVGTFAVTYKHWGRPHNDSDSCVAVNIDGTSNHLTTVVLPCDTLHPALCTNSSFRTPTTTQGNRPSTNQVITTNSVTTTRDFWPASTRLDTTSESNQESTSNGRAVTSNYSVSSAGISLLSSTPTVSAREASSNTNTQSQLATIVGSVVGTFAILIIIILVILWRRGVFRKKASDRSENNSDELRMRNPDKKDNVSTNDRISNNVYNHLGEITTTRRVPVEDLYDHTGAEGGTYGHVNSEKYDADSEYDHTFNHTSDTYGHLNRSYRHDDNSEYDHTGGDTYGRLNGHNRQSDDGSNYDHTGDMYSHLNAGKYRDVVDDVYDHTGGLGSVYGHTAISKPDGNSVYDNTMRFTT